MVGFVSSAFLFNACNSESTDMLLSSPMDSNVAFLSVIEKDYAPLNTIPENVSSRMAQDELQFWKKMSTRFYINYSFVETEYYQRYKNSFIKRMENLYNNMKWDGEPSKLSFFYGNKSQRVQSIAYDYSSPVPSDTGDIGREFDDFKSFNSKNEFYIAQYLVTFHAAGNVHAVGTPENFTCDWTNLNYYFTPSSVSFSGYIDLTPYGSELHISGKGRALYRSYQQYFAPDYYIGYIPGNEIVG